MSEITLLTDGSLCTESHVGYGAYLVLSDQEYSPKELKSRVELRRFEQTSSTRLELQTLLWALTDIQPLTQKVIIYTDSQTIVGLPARRERLEQTDYYSGKGRRLNNYELYQAFYRVTDQIDCQFIKVRGHQLSADKDEIDRLFTLVDRASRQAMRNDRSSRLQGKERDDENGRNET